MSRVHHPSDATLIGYAAGSLAEGAALVVACHLTACRECRHKAAIAETAGGVLLDQLPPLPLGPHSLADALSRLDAAPLPAPGAPPAPNEPWMPEPLRHYPLGRWHWIGPGIRQIVVVPATQGGRGACLLRLAPRTALPLHGHRGVELACVLLGAFSDERGRFAAGDVSEADEAVRHRPTADPHQGCICLVATGGPLRLDGGVGRLMQFFLRF